MGEERERGVTMDTDERQIEYEGTKILFVDTPGHRDFLINTI